MENKISKHPFNNIINNDPLNEETLNNSTVSSNDEDNDTIDQPINIMSHIINVRPDIAPIEYINKVEWLDGKFKTLKEGIIKDHERTFFSTNTAKYYNKLDWAKPFYYNKYQLHKLEQFMALIDVYLIQPAIASRRYSFNTGPNIIAAGVDIVGQDTARRRNFNKIRIYNIPCGSNGEMKK